MHETEDSFRTALDEFYARLDWLESVAGLGACGKFMDGKIDVPEYSGQYIGAILWSAEGCRSLSELLDQLKDGLAIPLIAVDSYYAHGKRWPAGMRLEGNRLVDTWPELHSGQLPQPTRNVAGLGGPAARTSGRPGKEAEPIQETGSLHPEDFEFDFSSVEIPTHEINEEEAAELADKLLFAMYNQPRKTRNPPQPRK